MMGQSKDDDDDGNNNNNNNNNNVNNNNDNNVDKNNDAATPRTEASKNKAVYRTAPVAGSWAGVVMI